MDITVLRLENAAQSSCRSLKTANLSDLAHRRNMKAAIRTYDLYRC